MLALAALPLLAVLEACANAEPRPEYLVEDTHYAELARKRLAGLR